MAKRWLVIVVPALLLVASAGALAQGTPTAEEAPPAVFVRQDPALGPYLADANGMTLYLFTRDTTSGESTCYDRCAENWPPFTAPEPLTLPGNVEGELTTITRTDGTTMVAYNGIPLYYYARDEQPGDVNGQGAGGVWFVVAPGTQFGVVTTVEGTPEATPAATPVAAGEVTVTLSEFAVMASATTFQVGQEYTFTVTNSGEFTHEFVIEPAGAVHAPLEADGQEAEIEEIAGGASASLTWTFTEPGTYQLACHLRSHYQQGMAVTIHVVA